NSISARASQDRDRKDRSAGSVGERRNGSFHRAPPLCARVRPSRRDEDLMSAFSRATLLSIEGRQIHPAKRLRVILAFAAGGAVDITARLIGQWLSERFGQQFVLHNGTGAQSSLAAQAFEDQLDHDFAGG